MVSVMPKFYREPFGFPLRWQDEQSGNLPGAVRAYFEHSIGMSKPFTETQLNLVIQYCQYYINAPCWMSNALQNGDEESIQEMQALIDGAQALRTAADIQRWIEACLEVGIDPL